MLLYDQIRRVLARQAHSHAEQILFKNLTKAVAFNGTDIAASLGQKMGEEAVRVPISKRPPYPHTWVEWHYTWETDDGRPEVYAVCGWLITWARVSDLTGSAASLAHHPAATEILLVHQFVNILESTRPTAPCGLGYDGSIVVSLTDEGCGFVTLSFNDNGCDGPPLQELFSKLPHTGLFIKGVNGPYWVPVSPWWVPLEILQLLHCKNIHTRTVTPPKALQKATVKRGHPPLCTYHTLALTLPQEITGGGTGSGTGGHLRLHLVRGHFKNLQHARFVTKGWHWWPAHVRGSAEVGVVEKDYALTTQEGP